MLNGNSLKFATATAAVAAIATTFAIASGTPQAAVQPAPTPVASVSPEIVKNFAIFREQPAVKMPADVAAEMASPVRFARNADLAREIVTPAGIGWIVPGDNVLCIIVPDPIDSYGEGCNTVESTLVRGLVLGLTDGPKGPGSVTALVPDGGYARTSDGSLPLRSTNGIVSSPVRAGQDLIVTPAKG